MSPKPTPALSQVRARHRPGWVLALYATRLLVGVVLAWPLGARAAELASGHPAGDLVFFQPGGLYLLEALRVSRAAIPHEIARAAAIVVLASYLGLFPLAAALSALADRGRSKLRTRLSSSLQVMGTLSLLLGLALASYAVLTSAALAALSLAVASLGTGAGLPSAAIVLGASLFLASCVGVVHDLARADAVVRGSRALAALGAAWEAFGARPWLDWSVRGALSLALVAASAWAVGAIGVEARAALFAVALIHQLTLLAVVGLRFSWLAAAIRALGRSAERAASTPQRSAR